MTMTAAQYSYTRRHPETSVFRANQVDVTTALPVVGTCQQADDEVSYLMNLGDSDGAVEVIREHLETTACLCLIGHETAREAARVTYSGADA